MMTRRELLNRLQQLAELGADMDLPLRVRAERKVTDKRTRSGHRLESRTFELRHACAGSNGCQGSEHRWGELTAAIHDDDFTGEWH